MRSISRPKFRTLIWVALAIAALLIWARWAPMDPLFDTPHSTVVLDRNGRLLGAIVAADGQWRMASNDRLPERLERCLLEFEDRHFMDHHGIHLPSIVRAWDQNRRSGRTVSGGSTITMQLARMSGQGGDRTYLRKLSETAKALRLELRMSKAEILKSYASNAPFGANVVGLEAAAWRWFGRPPESLGWAECAMLAVLPNSPARIHPGRNRSALQAKRDRLLARLLEIGAIDQMEYSLALDEPIPDAPVALPRKAPHVLTTLSTTNEGKSIRTTIDGGLQERITEMADRHATILRANEVHNAAVLVLDVISGEVLAYVGNLSSASGTHAPDVDIVQAQRSPGSLLKPFLYAAMLQEGEMMPDQLLADLPTHYEGFSPRNFEERFDGAVPASQALARSLNVPAVRALRSHGIDRTIRLVRQMGLHHVDRSADHYGLSLIVGGAESTLWELTGAYASLARIVLQYGGQGSADGALVHPPVLSLDEAPDRESSSAAPINAAAAYHTLMALQQLNRPETQLGWQHFGGEAIAWKTGTSFGHRDAWAIGVTDRFAVGVWTGNASGEGRPGLTGTLVAAPLLFEIFGILPNGNGFDIPYDAMQKMAICRQSGFRAAQDCIPVDTLWTIAEGTRTDPCPYHEPVLLDPTGRYRSAPSPDARPVSWFVLPPAMEHYYKISHPTYKPLPPWQPGEQQWTSSNTMEMIYPENGSRIHIPIQLDGSFGSIVLEAAHREPGARLHWDINGEHHGTTENEHRLPIGLPEGNHRLTLTDHRGHTLSTFFHVERGRLPSAL